MSSIDHPFGYDYNDFGGAIDNTSASLGGLLGHTSSTEPLDMNNLQNSGVPSQWMGGSDLTHLGLGLAGIIPGWGIPFDVADSAMYTAEGDAFGATMAGGSALLGAGLLGNLLHLPRKAWNAGKNLLKWSKPVQAPLKSKKYKDLIPIGKGLKGKHYQRKLNKVKQQILKEKLGQEGWDRYRFTFGDEAANQFKNVGEYNKFITNHVDEAFENTNLLSSKIVPNSPDAAGAFYEIDAIPAGGEFVREIPREVIIENAVNARKINPMGTQVHEVQHALQGNPTTRIVDKANYLPWLDETVPLTRQGKNLDKILKPFKTKINPKVVERVGEDINYWHNPDELLAMINESKYLSNQSVFQRAMNKMTLKENPGKKLDILAPGLRQSDIWDKLWMIPPTALTGSVLSRYLRQPSDGSSDIQ